MHSLQDIHTCGVVLCHQALSIFWIKWWPYFILTQWRRLFLCILTAFPRTNSSHRALRNCLRQIVSIGINNFPSVYSLWHILALNLMQRCQRDEKYFVLIHYFFNICSTPGRIQYIPILLCLRRTLNYSIHLIVTKGVRETIVLLK